MNFIKRGLLFTFLVLSFLHCEFLEDWQSKQFEKRFGRQKPSLDHIAEWEKLILKYEDVIEDKIETSLHLAKIHRKLGESYRDTEAFANCIKHLKKSIELGENENDNLYNLATCQGNYARQQGWTTLLLQDTERTLFVLLEQSPSYHRAKYQLAILYFYGFAKNNVKSIWESYSVKNANHFIEKAITLMQEFQSAEPKFFKSYFFLSNMYQENNQKKLAKLQLNTVIQILQVSYPNTYTQKKEYAKALNTLTEF